MNTGEQAYRRMLEQLGKPVRVGDEILVLQSISYNSPRHHNDEGRIHCEFSAFRGIFAEPPIKTHIEDQQLNRTPRQLPESYV